MKKIVLTLVAMMSLTFAQAETVKTSTPNTTTELNYDMTVDYRRLAVTLGLNLDQIQSVKTIHDKYIAEMDKIATSDNVDKESLVKKATAKNFKHMSYILDNTQYRKYNQLINATLVNRGLIK